LYCGLGYTDRHEQAERASQEVLSLPVHPALTDEDLHTVAAGVSSVAASQHRIFA
jgi:dTDP-4-amino-4,6-dideoxygalactose transaminase